MGTGISLGIGIPFTRRMGAGIDAQAQAHYDRVIADGGLIPSGLVGVNNFFKTVKAIYGTSDITTAISVGLDAQVLGYKLGAGAGTTAGQAAQKLYSCSGSSGDVVQTTAASQPLLLTHTSGENYYQGVGVTGNFVSTPNSAANSNNGNKEIIVKFSTNDTTSSSDIVSKDEVGSNRAYAILYDHSSQRFSIVITTDLTSTSVVNTDSGTILRNYAGWYKVTFTFSAGVLSIRTYESLDNINYTQVGSTITRNGNNFIGTNAILNIGSRSSTFGSCIAKIYRVTISNSIGGTPAVDFNPNSYNAATSQTQWTSSTGEIWSIQTGTATTGYKGVLVDRTIMQGDGVDDLLINAIVRPNILTQYLATNTYTNDNSGNAVLVDSNSGSYLNSIVAFTSIVGNIMNGFASDLTKAKSANVVYLVTTSNNSGVKNAISVNNGTETTNAYTPALSGNGISILSRSSGGTKANALIRTYLLSNAQDDSTVRTAMYNIIRSINNSAF